MYTSLLLATDKVAVEIQHILLLHWLGKAVDLKTEMQNIAWVSDRDAER